MEFKHLKRAISLAESSINQGGGPFGALIVKDGEVISEASNRVTLQHDPTAHAEIEAIRKAGEKLQTHDLSGCVLYASCEPCPMCLGAIYWAHIDTVVYAAGRKDAEQAGFDDKLIYEELAKEVSSRKIEMIFHEEPAAKELFIAWTRKSDKEPY